MGRSATGVAGSSTAPVGDGSPAGATERPGSGDGGIPSSPKSSRSWRDAIGVLWVIGAGIATLLPALIHGASLGPVQELSKYGVLQHPVPTVNGQFQFGLDPALLAIPWKALAWTQVHSGHLPLWNPYNVLGMPLAFNWQSAPFSLSALVGYLAPLRLVFTISVITSLVIGGTGVYALCRVLRLGVLGAAMAGTVYELSGPFMNLLSWQDTAVMCWAGWLFAVTLLIIRGEHRVRHVVEFAVIVALAGYAGQPEALFFLALSLGIFVAVMFLVRALRNDSMRSFVRPIGDLLVAGAAGLALFAPLCATGSPTLLDVGEEQVRNDRRRDDRPSATRDNPTRERTSPRRCPSTT